MAEIIQKKDKNCFFLIEVYVSLCPSSHAIFQITTTKWNSFYLPDTQYIVLGKRTEETN